MFEDQLSELWTVDSGLWTIIRIVKKESWAAGVIADNPVFLICKILNYRLLKNINIYHDHQNKKQGQLKLSPDLGSID